MDIIIVGDGKVGYALSEQLSQEHYNVTIIDNNLAALNETVETLDVMGVHGNGASRPVLLEAGAPNADLLIAATSTDELNMLCCLMAKTLGTRNTIARIRNPEYMSQLHLLQEQLGLSLAINPELAAARAIARVIKFPSAVRVDTFAKGRVELVEFRLPEESPVTGQPLMDLPIRPDTKILICAVEREGEVIIPNGRFVIQAGDKLHITGESHSLTEFLVLIGGINLKIRSLMIVGGGRIAYYLTSMLDTRQFQVTIVEKSLDRCNELCELLPHASILHGDGSDIDLLESEGLDEVDAFLSLTDMDEENLIMSMMAVHKQVPKVVTKVNRLNYLSMVEKMGIDTVVCPKRTTADEITQYVRAMHNTAGSKPDTLYRLVDGKVEALEFTVGAQTPHLGQALMDLSLRPDLLLAAIVRHGKVIIPRGRDCMQPGDSVVVFVDSRYALADLNDIFSE